MPSSFSYALLYYKISNLFCFVLVIADFSTQMYYEGTKEKLKNFARNLAIFQPKYNVKGEKKSDI